MEERNQQQRITQHLQSAEVQQRILQDMQRAREEATVTISNAASLFNFSENQLRDWEKTGLLNPQRRMHDIEQDGKGAKRRQYTTSELDKLAIIRELMNASFSPGIIPTYVDEIWAEVAAISEPKPKERLVEESGKDTEHRPIDQRVEQIEKAAFWRYFVSQALRLSLLLICEDVPDTVAGIILPLEENNFAETVRSPYELNKAGYSLVGWLSQSRSFYTFLESEPSFEHPSDFRVESLANLTEYSSEKQGLQNNILIIVQRRAKLLIISKEVAKTVQKMLGLVYETIDQWRPTFENGVRDWMYQMADFTSSSTVSDEVLNGLANIIVQLGEKMEDGQDRWRFCCIALPEDPSLPVQQRKLVVRAQSTHAPHSLAISSVSAKTPGLTFRAYQSGQIIYRSCVPKKDFMVAHRELEISTRSAIAIPNAGDDGLAVGVIYVASNFVDAFSIDDQRALRLISRMVEELVVMYRVRKLTPNKLAEAIAAPTVIDTSFKDFLSESDFANDIEVLLKDLQITDEAEVFPQKEISFIAIDIDNQSSLAMKYGDRVARNLSRAVGLRLQGQLRLFANLEHRRLYHVYADRFYLLLKSIPLDDARSKAAQFRAALSGEYRLDARRITTGRPLSREDMLKLSDVTVRLGITSYTYTKMNEVLHRYIPETAVTEVVALITRSLDEVLEIGQRDGGDVIVSWDRDSWGYKRWEPS